MEYLAALYGSDAYRAYVDPSPRASVGIVASSKKYSTMIMDAIVKDAEHDLNVLEFSSMKQVYRKGQHRGLADRCGGGILKAQWCVKHQRRVVGCLVVVVDWDITGDVSRFESSILQLCDDAREITRYSSTRIVVAAVTTGGVRSESLSSSTSISLDEFQLVIRGKLGIEQKAILPVWSAGGHPASLGRVVAVAGEFAARYHTDEIARLKRLRVDIARSKAAVVLEIRNRFKTAWHYLVLEEYTAAQQSFEKCYELLITWRRGEPSYIDARMCATLVLVHLIRLPQITLAERERFLVMGHVHWLSAPFSSSLSAPVLRASGILRSLLLSEWYVAMSQCSSLADAISKADCLRAAGTYLTSLMHDMPLRSSAASAELDPPIFVGMEYLSFNFLTALESQLGDGKVLQRALSLIREADELTPAKSRLQLNSQLLATCSSASVVGRESSYLALTQYLTDWTTTKFREMVGMVHHELAKLCCEMLREESMQTPSSATRADLLRQLRLCIVSCICSATCEGQQEAELRRIEATLQRLQQPSVGVSEKAAIIPTTQLISGEYVADLEYPAVGHFPPFSVAAHFSTPFALAGSADGGAILRLSFCANHWPSVRLENIVILFSACSRENSNADQVRQYRRESLSSLTTTCKPMTLLPGVPTKRKVRLSFSEVALVECTSIRATVIFGGGPEAFQVGAVLTFDNTDYLSDFDNMSYSLWGVMPSRNSQGHRPVIQVVNPLSGIQLHVPQTLHVVEGEDASLELVVAAVKEDAHQPKLIVPYLPDFYEVGKILSGEFHRLQDHHRAPGSQSLTPQHRVAVLHGIPNIELGSRKTVTIVIRCIQAGRYEIPFSLQYTTLKFPKMETVSYMPLLIHPPVLAKHSVYTTSQWIATDSCDMALSAPAVASAVVVDEKMAFVRPSEVIEDASRPNLDDSVELLLAYRSLAPDAADALVTSMGSEVVVTTTLATSVPGGLTINKIVAYPSKDFSLVSSYTGTFPCRLDCFDEMTLTVTFAPRSEGRQLLGLLEIVACRGDGSNCVLSRLSLPEVIVEDTPIAFSMQYPHTAYVGLPFLVSLVLTSTVSVPFSLEMSVSGAPPSFVVGGRTVWSICIGAHETKTTELQLLPLAAGSFSLPNVTIKNIANGTVVARGDEERPITVLSTVHRHRDPR